MATLTGTPDHDVIDASSYGDSTNFIYGYAGDDTLYGGGSDNIYAGVGNDVVFSGSDHDYIDGEAGDDYIDSGEGNDYIKGNEGNDTLLGLDGDDGLFGDAGSDKLVGDDGNDVLNGGGYTYNSAEFDTLNGGAGADTFALGDAYGTYYMGWGHAVVEDFKYGEEDKIQLKGKASDYSFKDEHFGGSTSIKDTAIYKGGDLVAVLHDAPTANSSFVPSLDVIWV